MTAHCPDKHPGEWLFTVLINTLARITHCPDKHPGEWLLTVLINTLENDYSLSWWTPWRVATRCLDKHPGEWPEDWICSLFQVAFPLRETQLDHHGYYRKPRTATTHYIRINRICSGLVKDNRLSVKNSPQGKETGNEQVHLMITVQVVIFYQIKLLNIKLPNSCCRVMVLFELDWTDIGYHSRLIISKLFKIALC